MPRLRAASLLPLSSTVSAEAAEIRAADLDGDGDQDLLLAGTASIAWFTNNGNATFSPAQSIPLTGLVGSPLLGQRPFHVWEIGDICNGLMAFPNLIALLFLSPVVVRLTKEYAARK